MGRDETTGKRDEVARASVLLLIRGGAKSSPKNGNYIRVNHRFSASPDPRFSFFPGFFFATFLLYDRSTIRESKVLSPRMMYGRGTAVVLFPINATQLQQKPLVAVPRKLKLISQIKSARIFAALRPKSQLTTNYEVSGLKNVYARRLDQFIKYSRSFACPARGACFVGGMGKSCVLVGMWSREKWGKCVIGRKRMIGVLGEFWDVRNERENSDARGEESKI